ncbi:SusD/RagB family nutrient-binding outer membrane lipoprotein [Jiulongibacter sp. NS-SX5]|uniref:SusD/RagB family nutrient-binding outer membrane lipoprotein n=1 Tax=Jiulongibacter sp. NS-SX5 TaxID=3463854 RepID=UPI004058CD8B
MKKHKSIYTFLLGATMFFAGNSCTDGFEEMNTDPNNPTEIGSQYLLPYAIEQSVDRYWGGSTRFERLNLDGAMLWIQYLARNIYSNEGDSYGITPAFYNNTWESLYNDGLTNFERIITLTGPEGVNPNTNYEGVALVMKTWVYSLLTDMYGAVPYSAAVSGSAEEPIYTPEYDSMESIYAGMLADLKTANEKLTIGGPDISGDIIYYGDIMKWKKFANSLRLKLANRQAAKKPSESAAIMAEILGSPSTYPIFESNADNATLEHTGTRPSNNTWNEVMVIGGRTDWSMSKTFVDMLTATGDTRLGAIATEVNGTYAGIPNGLPDAIATTYLSSASVLQSSFSDAAAPSVLMTFSELNFILAEAAADGDISGDADAYMAAGIEASYDAFGLDVPAGFIDGLGGASKETIMTQKYIALFGQGVEAWTEYRRTGFPTFPAADPRAIFENDGVIPTRLPYPTTEYSLNKTSLDGGISLNGGPDNMQTTLWWAE